PHTTPIGPYKRKRDTSAITPRAEVDVYCEETQRKAENSLENSNENAVEATKHRDVLILFRGWSSILGPFSSIISWLLQYLSPMDVLHGQSSISFKNTPVLKATASRLCGPLFDWIVTWEMLSRIKYLGTMLFLHNFEKAVQCLWTVLRAIRSFLSFLNLPLAGPFMEFLDFLFPVWNMFSEAIESFFSVICIGIGFIISLVGDLLEV
ncbi:hypothetical protein Godav_027305, partial [Gossypium davidsonii]|nr:hypothetical protein [Gossypium davidsonii]